MQLGKTLQVENVVDVEIEETLPVVVQTADEVTVDARGLPVNA